MTYDEALEQTKEQKDNLLLFTLDYTQVLLPYDQGLVLLECLKNAEALKYAYNTEHTKIETFDGSNAKIGLFSYKQYQDIKVAQLMGISYKELLERNK
jgi:hypothetical protein